MIAKGRMMKLGFGWAGVNGVLMLRMVMLGYYCLSERRRPCFIHFLGVYSLKAS